MGVSTEEVICTGGVGRHLPIHPIQRCEHVVTDGPVVVFRCPVCGSYREREVESGG